jgi:hypothetical protein
MLCDMHWLLLSLAWADPRDDDIFGSPDPEEESGASLLEAPSTTDASILDKLDARDKTLALGGRIYLRTDLGFRENGDDVSLSSPNLAELYADARPNDRVRAYFRGRMTHDWTLGSEQVDPFTGEEVKATRAVVDQLYVKFDVAQRVYVTLGQQRVKWGAGRFWNPTDFMNQQRLDPLAVFDLRTGAGLLKLHVPVEAAGLNFYGLANLDGATVGGDIGAAGRVEWLVGQTEMSTTFAARKGTPMKIGADVTSGVWLVDIRLEGSLSRGEGDRYWQGNFDPAALTFPTELDRSDEWIPQAVAGLEFSVRYNDEDALSLGGEFFYNGAGYQNADLYDWLWFNEDFVPLYAGQMYAGAYAYLPGPGRLDDVTFIGSYLTNLSDGSGLVRLDYRHLLLTHLNLNVYGVAHPGKLGELRYGVEVPAIPGVVDAFTVEPPVFEAGIGATVNF